MENIIVVSENAIFKCGALNVINIPYYTSQSGIWRWARFLSCFIFSAIPKVVHLPRLSQSTSRFPLPGMTPSLLAIVGVYSIFLTLSDRTKEVSIVNTKHNGWISLVTQSILQKMATSIEAIRVF